jgi:hypothetical protein
VPPGCSTMPTPGSSPRSTESRCRALRFLGWWGQLPVQPAVQDEQPPHGGGAVDRGRRLPQGGRGQGRAHLGQLCA